MIYRIFTNDRGEVGGVKKYSCYSQTAADSATEAEKLYDYDVKRGMPEVKAIAWPPDADGLAWIAKHV